MSSSRRRRHARSSSPSAAPLEDDDLLSEILLRLPLLPSSLPCASAVCKRWRSLASDPAFSRRFRLCHRRNRPLLGFFHRGTHGLSFVPTLEAPNRVPPGRFSLQFDNQINFFGCRHGLVLIFDHKPLQFLVWDPVTGQRHRLAIPPGFDPTMARVNGAVLRSAAGDVKHFKVVLVVVDNKDILNRQVLACVYSSDTGVWGNLVSSTIPSEDFAIVSTRPAMLIGDSLYWVLGGSSCNIIEFDLERGNLSLIPMSVVPFSNELCGSTVMRAEGRGPGLLSLPGFIAQLWKRKTDSHGVSSWVMERTIELEKLLSLNSEEVRRPLRILGYAEDNNLLILWSGVRFFTVQLESLQFKELPKPEIMYLCHPFESVYAAGI